MSYARLVSVFVSVFVFGCLVGCGSVRSEANDAFSRKDWVRAAELYEKVLAEHPGDAEAKARLVESRTHVVEGLFDQCRQLRSSNQVDAAIRKVDEALHLLHVWQLQLTGPVRQRTNEELTWAGHSIRDEVRSLAQSGRPLAAEAAITKRMALLSYPEYATIKGDVEHTVSETGRTKCTKIAAFAKPDAPFLSHRIAAYCAHFGATVAIEANVPLLSKVVVQGKIDGTNDEQRQRLDAALNTWLKRSSWYSADSPRAAVAFVQGKHTASFKTINVQLTQPWKEAIEYQELENYQEPYTETYTDYEHYTEQVPYTAYETRTKTCGFGSHTYSCSEQVPVTRYRTESRTRPVTKTRTKYRNAVRTVTKVRYEDRIFSYSARELRGEYDASWTVQITLVEGAQPMVLKGGGSASRKGYDHDVTFAPAGVHPQHDVLMTHDGWFLVQLGEMEKTFQEASAQHWKRTYCQSPSFTEEEAARCAWERTGGYPPGVRAALAKVYGADVDAALKLDP